MSLPHRSVATIDFPEFLNLQPLDINPMMSQCEIKVFYIGENRNGSYIGKEVAAEMAKTLRGAPIVGYFKESKDDFADHGHQVTIDDEGVHFSTLTKPYGFVAPDAKVWFQKFTDEDDFGNPIEREYLMTTGYLWTGQYPETQQVIDAGKPQSMELDNETLQGHWAENSKNGLELFIINDAIVSKLCILGDDTEPCFEGAAVTAPQVSTNFTLDDEFKTTLYNMMKELEFALKGDHTVNIEAVDIKEPAEFVEEEIVLDEEFAADASNSSDSAKEEEVDFEIKQEDDSAEAHTEKQKLQAGGNSIPEVEEEIEEPAQEVQKVVKSDVAPAIENTLVDMDNYVSKEEYSALENRFNELKVEYDKLVEFQNEIEDQQKDALINKFFMLSDEDKKDVIDNKRSYSLDDIEAKLAVICYRKKVNFSLDDSSKIKEEQTDEPVVVFDLHMDDSTPDWIKAVEDVQNRI